MRLPSALIVVSAAVMPIGTLPAIAATVNDNVTFSATSFSGGAPPSYTVGTAPVDPVTGSFTITFDPTKTYLDSTTGITLGSLNISLDSALSFDYSPSSYVIGLTTFAAGELVVGGLDDGACCIVIPVTSNDFYLQILNFTSAPAFNQLGYSIAADGDYFYSTIGASGGSVSVTPEVSTTPLPAALPLFAAGLGAMGLFGWRRKRKASDAMAAV